MAIFINGIEFLTGFLRGKEYEGWMQGEKIWPADEISITYVQFLLESLPEGYTGLTKLTQIPACGATVRSAVLTYQYDDGWCEHHIGEIQVEFTDGAISAESKYYTESGATLVGTRHADFEIDGVEFKDFAIEVYQEANVITKTDRSEPAVPLKEDAWYYYTPDIKAFSYTGAGLLASGGNATPSFRVSITKIMSRYLKTEKTWKDMQSTAMEQVGMAPRQIDVMGGVEEWVDISAPVTNEYTDTASGEVTIKFDASNLIAAASLVSYDTGVISVASMGTTSYPNGRTIGNAKIIVSVPRIRTGEQSRVEKSVTLSQGSNTKTVSGSAYTGIKSAELIDANGNKITSVLSYEAQMIFIRTQAIKTITYTWTSGAESTGTEYEYKRADSYTRSNTALFTIMDSWSYTLNAVPVSISKNTDKSNRRGGYIVAAINGKYATTQSITQEVNTEPESTTADTYLAPVSYQSSVTSDGQYVYVWDLKRTNKPMSASTVVKYSFTKAGPSVTPTTITGSVYVSASEAEGNVVKANVASGVMVVVVNYKETV